MARVAATAAASTGLRWAAVRTATSISFWWLRWTVQSRSPRWMAAVAIAGEHLDLDVATALDQPLEEHPLVAERGLGLAGGLVGEGLLDLVRPRATRMPRRRRRSALRMTG